MRSPNGSMIDCCAFAASGRCARGDLKETVVIFEILTVLANVGTAVGVGVGVWQLRSTKRQNRVQFEDGLAKEYRELAQQLPVAALVGEALNAEELARYLPLFYRYFGLTNEQIFLRHCNRVSKETWKDWLEGIESNMNLTAFQQAWKEFQSKPAQRFSDLQHLARERFESDPRAWPRIAWSEKRQSLLPEHSPGRGPETVKSGEA